MWGRGGKFANLIFLREKRLQAGEQKPDKDGANFEGTLSGDFHKISYLPKLSTA